MADSKNKKEQFIKATLSIDIRLTIVDRLITV